MLYDYWTFNQNGCKIVEKPYIQMMNCANGVTFDSLTDSCSSADEKRHEPSTMSLSLALVPYVESVIPDFHKLERKFSFSGERYVSIQQNWAVGGVSAVVWDAAIVLAEYLAKHPDLLISRKVIELGAGTGLAGIIAAQMRAHVVITDRSVALKTLQDNVVLNHENVTGSVQVEELVWGENLDRYSEPFDVILGADIIYVEETFSDLLKTIKQLSDQNTTVLLSCRIRYPRDRHFLTMLQEVFSVKEVLYDTKRDVYLYSAVKNS